ncbi:MAG: glycosyltransferase family 39 protein [Myxococcales bacterium]|nr:glycosyltransferase family 39 protein [Myxococcales bacterium]
MKANSSPNAFIFLDEPASHPDQQELQMVGGIWFAALMLRLFNLLEIRTSDPFFQQPSVDPLFYHTWATQISAGDWLGEGVFLQGPLYPYLLSLLYTLTGPGLYLPRFLNCVIGSLTCVLVWRIAREFFGRRTGLVASAIAAIYAMFIFYEGSLLIVNILLPLNLWVVWCGMRAMEAPSNGRWLGLGMLIGLTALARPNMLLYGPAALVLLFALLPNAQGLSRRFVLAGCLLAGIGTTVFPATLRNYVVTGDRVLVSASAGMNFFNGNNPDANGTHNVPRIFDRSTADHPREQNLIYQAYAEHELGRTLLASEVSTYWMGRGIDYVIANPAEWLRLTGRKFLYFINAHEIWNNRSYTVTRQFSWVLRLPLIGFGLVGPLAMLGFVVTANRWRKLAPLYALIGVHLATCLIFFVLSRYRIPAVPVLIMFAAAACVWLFDAMRARRTSFAIALVALLGAAGACNVDLRNEDLSVAYYNLGNRYRLSNQHEKAIDQYRESLRIDSQYISARNNLAISLELSGNHHQEAIDAWRALGEMGRKRGLSRYVERAERHLRVLDH